MIEKINLRTLKKLFNRQGSIIEESGKVHLVGEILEDADNLFENIPPRSLVILFCANDYESISFYINAIQRNILVLLLDADIDEVLTRSILKNYEPDFVFLSSKKEIQNNSFLPNTSFKNYILYKNQLSSSKNINRNLAVLLSTSGSTGTPKLVRLSYNNLLSNASSIAEYLSIDNSQRAITTLPMSYAFGLSIINSHLFSGASIVITTKSYIQHEFWQLFKNTNVTSLSGVPYTYNIFKKLKLLDSPLPSLKTLTQAGGKLSNDLIEYFSKMALTKGIKFYIMYGQTEGTARLSYLEPEYNLEKIGSIGKPIPGGEFEIVDNQNNLITKPYVSGELIYKGPNVMLGYANCREDLNLGDINKGVLRTGDLGYLDADGFYFLSGRIKRFIKLFGNRINLDSLEKLFEEIGIESACTGKDNSLIVYILRNQNAEKALKFLKYKLKIHSSAVDIRVVEKIPRNQSGKILYSKLIEDKT